MRVEAVIPTSFRPKGQFRPLFAGAKGHALGLCFFFGIHGRSAGLHATLALGLTPEVLRAVGFLCREAFPASVKGFLNFLNGGRLLTQNNLEQHGESRARRRRTRH